MNIKVVFEVNKMQVTFMPSLFYVLELISHSPSCLGHWLLPRLRSTLKFSSVNHKTLQDCIPLIACDFSP